MYAIRFYTEDDDARGANNDGLPDVMNRPIRDLLVGSGYLADGSDFDGFARLPDVIALSNPFMTQTTVATDATPFGSGGSTNQRSYVLTGTFNAAQERQLRIFSAEATYQGSSVSGSVVAGAISSGQTGRSFTGHISKATGFVAIGARLVSSGIVDAIHGISGYAYGRGGTAGALRGVTAQVRTINDPLATDGPTTITGDAVAFYVEPGFLHASTTIAGNTYGFYMDDPSTWGGTVTGKRYGIYIAGGESYFGGNVTGGTATGNLFWMLGQAARNDGGAQNSQVQLRRNALGSAQHHYHVGPPTPNAGVGMEWGHGTWADGRWSLFDADMEDRWTVYQEDAAPNIANGPRTGYWQDIYGNVHQNGQIVQDVLHDDTWVSTSLSTTTPVSSQNAWITKATIDANDSTTRQFRAFYGWTQYRGSGVSGTSVQGGLFYGETAENFTGGISQAVGAVCIGSRLVAGTGTIGTHIGVSGVAFSAGGPSTHMWGVQSTIIALGTSALTTVRGVMVDVSNISGTTTISGDLAGVHVTDVNTWGGVVAGKRYAINTEGGGIRFMSASTVAAPSTGTAYFMNVWATSTDATPTSFGTNMVTIQQIHTNNSSSARQPRTMYVISYYNGSGVNTSSVQGALFEAAVDPTFSGSIGSVIGLNVQSARNASAGHLTSTTSGLVGISINANSFSGTGTISMVQGLQVNLITIGATHTVTGDVRSINVPRATLGTMTIAGSLYGLYVDDVTQWGATVTGTRYGIYVGGGAVHLGAGPMYLLSPNGSRWSVTVSNAGALVVAAA